ncbi:hypothetical protein F8G81_22945 [Arthrobacter sp. CDRTa11]|uniref:hypothetical protein n=1 Tax=Arthrobacter sp. CDRTa11 TaxID=2651199 RepID=UPI002265A27A|nr:hypothetical protein [Arthrobacter sp. CDRTa11]UZX05130.1 hypothetical protein F8G81_22945 [Arthrobacter sp. CDRTa11]
MKILDVIWNAVLGVSAIAPLATFGVVLVAYLTYRQKAHADRRDQWWKRAQWAIDSALNDADPQRRLAGMRVLVQLVGSDLATAEDADLMSALAVGIQTQELARLSTGAGASGLRPDGRADKRAGDGPAVVDRILAEAEKLIAAAEARSARP